jgi:hydroxyacylglutathione hydrolase
MVIEKINDKIYKISLFSNTYVIIDKEITLIDLGINSQKKLLKEELEKIINLDNVKKVIFTHFHYDHCGNFDLFKNAVFFASEKEIELFNNNSFDTVLNETTANELKKIKLEKLPKVISNLKVINTPGHTLGSVCLYDEKNKILFSGDTIFNNGYIGRVDLPTSSSLEMKKTLDNLKKIDYEILCPGHDY